MSVTGISSAQMSGEMQVMVRLLMLGDRTNAQAVSELVQQNLKGNLKVELVNETISADGATPPHALDVSV